MKQSLEELQRVAEKLGYPFVVFQYRICIDGIPATPLSDGDLLLAILNRAKVLGYHRESSNSRELGYCLFKKNGAVVSAASNVLGDELDAVFQAFFHLPPFPLMPDPAIEIEHLRFEEWVQEKHPSLLPNLSNDGALRREGKYFNHLMNCMWLAWQAARTG